MLKISKLKFSERAWACHPNCAHMYKVWADSISMIFRTIDLKRPSTGFPLCYSTKTPLDFMTWWLDKWKINKMGPIHELITQRLLIFSDDFNERDNVLDWTTWQYLSTFLPNLWMNPLGNLLSVMNGYSSSSRLSWNKVKKCLLHGFGESLRPQSGPY